MPIRGIILPLFLLAERRKEMSPTETKKHPCPDCTFCQWCSDDRCALCLRTDSCCKKKLSVAEQIALYDGINRKSQPLCGDDETLDYLHDFELKIVQPKSGYRFSLDPLLLCDFAPTELTDILDLGTGCGVIALLMARKDLRAKVAAVEVSPLMAAIANRNIVKNNLSDRITVTESDILQVSRKYSADSFDLVIGNPPYRRHGEGKISPKEGRDIARHESSAKLADFLAIAKKMVKPGGSICFIYHPERLAELFTIALQLKLSPSRLQMVHGDFSLPARMFMIELLKGKKSSLEVMPPISVKESTYGEKQQAGMRRGR
jgi:tRNA1Val (adenine37-N6)-methyltransferase